MSIQTTVRALGIFRIYYSSSFAYLILVSTIRIVGIMISDRKPLGLCVVSEIITVD